MKLIIIESMKRRSRLSVLFLILILPAAQFGAAQNIETEPRLEPAAEAYSFAESFDPSDWRELTELAYWASGDSGYEDAAVVLAPAIEELSGLTAAMDARAKGEAVLEFIHNRFLKSYREHQSSLEVLLGSGRFNCLSSAVLYTILGTAVGLDVSGVNTIDHAFCSVTTAGGQIDVETTNPYGFEPGTRIDFHDGFGKTTGFAYVPPSNYRNRTSINKKRLFSLLLQNRIAAAESRGRYYEAVGLAVDRWVLLGGGEGAEFEDLIIRMLNYGTVLSRAGREEEALAWIEKGVAAYGPHPKWDDFTEGVVNNLLIKLMRSGQLEKARNRIDELKPVLTAGAALKLERMVADSELVAALDAVKAGGSDEQFQAVLDKTKRDGLVSAARIREIAVVYRIDILNIIAGEEGWLAAWRAADDAVSELGSGPQLQRARRIYRENHRAELYNAAADAYNRGSYLEAEEIVLAAMVVFPGEAVFRSLLRNIERVLSTE